jgi:hypothetical protein
VRLQELFLIGTQGEKVTEIGGLEVLTALEVRRVWVLGKEA